MKKIGLLFVFFTLIFFTCSTASAFWVFTPKDKKITNPSKVVKDTPQKQYEYAMSLFEAQSYKDAGDEFLRLVGKWKDSKFAPEAQYYAGLSYQKAGKRFIAFGNYQKVVEFYPYSKRLQEIVKAEYEIGEYYYQKTDAKLMGVEIMGDVEKAIEVFSAIIEHMPYSEYADKAQFMIGKSHKKLLQYTDAVFAFKKLVQEYPKSPLVDRAKYEVAECMSLAAKSSDYDQTTTDEAIEEFKKYSQDFSDKAVALEAQQTLNLLRERKAKSVYDIAEFYLRMKKYRAAYIYYSQVINEYKDTTYFKLASGKLKDIQPILDKQDGKITSVKSKKKKASALDQVMGKMFGSKEAKVKKQDKTKDVKKADVDIATESDQQEQVQKKPEKKTFLTRAFDSFLGDAKYKKTSKPQTEDKGEKKETQKKKSKGFFGYTSSNVIYDGAESIFIGAFENKIDFTREVSDNRMYVGYRSGMELEVTRLIIDRFLFDGALRITTKKDADLILEGALLNFIKEAIRYDKNDNVIEYRLKVVIDFKVTAADTQKILVDYPHFTGETTYRTTGAYAISEDRAIREAVEDLAVRVVNVVVESW